MRRLPCLSVPNTTYRLMTQSSQFCTTILLTTYISAISLPITLVQYFTCYIYIFIYIRILSENRTIRPPTMSTYHLSPLELPDFDTLISHALHYPPGDDLVGPPTPLCCPVTTQQEASARLAFHFGKQRDRFLDDPTVRYMKVVERDANGEASGDEIISLARWHFYPTGYSFARDVHWETHDGASDREIPKGFNVQLHNYILSTRDAARSEWMEAGKPCWVLMHMVTRPVHRGKGAAGMLIRWGIEQAEKDGVPAYLEAGVMGRPIYERYGFVQVGELLEVNMAAGGGEGVFVMCKMGYFPNGSGGGGMDERVG